MTDFTPKGEGEVKTNPIDLNDDIDRKNKAKAIDKLRWVCDRVHQQFGRDPRAGGFSFVAQSDVIEQVFAELHERDRKLQQAVVLGPFDGDVVGWWIHRASERPMAFRVRQKARTAGGLWCVPDDVIIPSDMADRKAAGMIRLALWRGEIVVAS